MTSSVDGRASIQENLRPFRLPLSLFALSLAIRLASVMPLDFVEIGKTHWSFTVYGLLSLHMDEAGSYAAISEQEIASVLARPFGYVYLTNWMMHLCADTPTDEVTTKRFHHIRFLETRPRLLQGMAVFQCLFDALASVVFFFGLRRLTGTLAAAMAFGLYAVNAEIVLNLSIFMPDSLMPAFVALTVGTAGLFFDSTKRWAWAIPGAVAGFATLMRPDAVALLGLLMLVSLFYPSGWKAKLRSATVLVATWMLVMSPWWITTYRISGRVIPLSTSGPCAFLYGLPHFGVPCEWAGMDEFYMNAWVVKRSGDPDAHPHRSSDQAFLQRAYGDFFRKHPWTVLECGLYRAREILTTFGHVEKSPAFKDHVLNRIRKRFRFAHFFLLLSGGMFAVYGWRRGLALILLCPFYNVFTNGMIYFEHRYIISLSIGFLLAFSVVSAWALGRWARWSSKGPAWLVDSTKVICETQLTGHPRWRMAWFLLVAGATLAFVLFSKFLFTPLMDRKEGRFHEELAAWPQPAYAIDELFPGSANTELRLDEDGKLDSTRLDREIPWPAFYFMDVEVLDGNLAVFMNDHYERMMTVLPSGSRYTAVHSIGISHADTRIRFRGGWNKETAFVLHDLRIVDARELPVRVNMERFYSVRKK